MKKLLFSFLFLTASVYAMDDKSNEQTQTNKIIKLPIVKTVIEHIKRGKEITFRQTEPVSIPVSGKEETTESFFVAISPPFFWCGGVYGDGYYESNDLRSSYH